MLTPQANGHGYDTSAITNVSALAHNVRFLVMHGVADDNVHFQNSLTLLDKLDLAGVENYDVHVFPDSDHSIYFHNGNRIKAVTVSVSSCGGVWGVCVYADYSAELSSWLVNAFNGEWLCGQPEAEREEEVAPAGVRFWKSDGVRYIGLRALNGGARAFDFWVFIYYRSLQCIALVSCT